MKIKKLFALAVAMLCTAVTWAQTDVTSTYLTNADFSQSTPLTGTYLYGYGKDGLPYGFQTIEGWTSVVTAGDNSNSSYPNSGMAAGVFAYGSSTQLKGNSKAAPATNPNGEASGNCFGFFGVWGDGGYYYQNVTLAAGKYTITVPMYNQSGTQANTTYTGFFPTSGTNRTVAVNPTVGQWVNQTVTFTLAAETEGQIRIGYQSTGSGSAANPMLFIDCVKIEFTSQVVKDVLVTALASANSINGRLSDSDLTSAIATAQAVYDNINATQEQVNSAAETLDSAVETAMANAIIGGTEATVALANADLASLDGWTVASSSSFNDKGNGLIGTYQVRFSPATVDATHLATEYCFGFEARWGGNFASYNQTTVALPAGVYTLTYDVENVNSATQNLTYADYSFVQVGDTKYYSAETEWMKGQSSWTTHSIHVTLENPAPLTVSFGYGTGSNNSSADVTPALYVSHVKLTWSDPLQAAKDALGAEIAKAQLCDAKEGLASAIAAAQSVLDTATTQAELEQALADLQAADKDAVLRYENGLADAAATNGMLTGFVVNGTFDSNTNGWTCTGGFQNQALASNQHGDFTVPFFENWNGSAKVNKMYQNINNIPNGTYKLKIAAFVQDLADPNESQYVYANNDKTYLTTGDPTFYEVWTVVTTNAVEIGLEQTTATTQWMGIDNVTLTYYGAGDVIAQAQAGAHKANWEEALANANAALANSDYANVTGSEKTALQTEVAKAEPTTAQGYDDATAALNTAISTFTTAKSSYDFYVDAVAMYTPFGVSVTAPTTADEAVEAARALNVAAFAAAKADYPIDATAVYPTSWSGSLTSTSSGQHWSGDASISYADNWSGSANTVSRSTTLSLPAGEFVLMSAGRGSANTVVTMEANGVTVTYANNGDLGRGIDTDGNANFSTEGTYANENIGRGWEWRMIPVTLTAATDVTVTQTIARLAGNSWGSFVDFTVLKKSVVATAEDYEALNSAIEAAENRTFGFGVGEYAPYINIEPLRILATAKALDQTAVNAQEDVHALIAELNTAAWIANSADVDAIYNGMFATVTEGANYPDGWARTNGWGQMQSALSGDFETAYYNQPGSLKYGTTGVYTMPLAANTVYKLTFSYRSHENNSNHGVTASILNGEDGLSGKTFPGNGSTSDWATVSTFFTTGAAGNYVLTLANNGNTWMTNVSLVKAEIVDITYLETNDNTIEEAYANVMVSRSIKAGYNTVVLPFDLTADQVADAFGAGTKVYNFSETSDDSNNVTINFNEGDGSITANVPVLVKATEATSAQTFNNVITVPASEAQVGGNNVSFVGTYAPITVAAGDYFVSGGLLYKSAGATNLKAFRAYIDAQEASSVKMFIDGLETAISAINAEAEAEQGAIYNLAGQRVSKAVRGIYVKNGKKVVVK